MTDEINDAPGQEAAEAQRARIEALRQRRAATRDLGVGPDPAATRRRVRRRHPAHGARLIAATVGVCTTLGLIGYMSLDATAASNAPPAPSDTTSTLTAPPRTSPTASSSPPFTPQLAQPPSAISPATAPPVPLTVAPTVRPATPTTAAPVARTHGSH